MSGGVCRVPPRRAVLDLPLIGRRTFIAPLRGALGEPPSAAGIAGSRPGGRPHFLYGQEMGERSRRGLCPLDPRAASGWPSAKVGGAPPRMSERAYSIPPAAAPRAQCLCPRVSGTVPEVRPGRHGRFCVARSAHGEAENRAVQPPARAKRANARNGRCFPPGVPGEPSGFGRWERKAHVSCGPCPQLTPRSVKPMRVRLTGGGSATLPRVPLPGKLAAPFPSLGAPAT